MNKEYLTHWIIGLVATVVWFWGDRAGIPPAAISLAATIVPTTVVHAMATASAKSLQYDPPPTTLPDPTVDNSSGGASSS